MSENYLQHADHFTRILSEQENYRKQKFEENKSTETAAVAELATESKKLDEKVVAEIKNTVEKKTEAN